MNLLAAAAILLQVQVRDEAKEWKRVESANFNVYYPVDEMLPRAREFAGWFEEARVDLSARTGVAPPRINVFLYRSFHDLAKSSYLGSPRPLHRRVREPSAEREAVHDPCRLNPRSRALALADPLRDRIFIHCQASDRWNYWFAKHELAHHVQFEHLYAFRLPSWLIALKDPIVPAWWFEGGADYLAGAFDSHKDEFVRSLAEDRLYNLKELHTPDILDPRDALAHYHEGAYFWRFLDERYARDTGRRLFERTDHGLPLASQKPLQAVTGRSRKEVERDFHEHLQAGWAPLMAGRAVPEERLTDTRAHYRRRAWAGRWSPDGKKLAWISNEHVVPDVYVDGKGLLGLDRSVDGSRVVSPPSWSPDGKRLVVVEQVTHRDRLLLIDMEGASDAVELEFDELYDPAWSPDGGRIAFAALKHGTSDLYLYTLADGSVERLTNDPDGDSAPAWSKDGKLAWIKETEGRTVLHIRGRGAVTTSWALLEYPQWSPDGASIVLAADVGGVYDAFAVDPATGRAKRLTRFRGGVSYPACHPTDGTIGITYYEGRGSDLFKVKPEPQDEPAFDQEERKDWYRSFKKPEPQGTPAEKSRVWGVDWLMFPVTHPSLVTPGLEFQAGDRDAENTFSMIAAGTSRDAWGVTAVAANKRWRPTMGVAATAARVDDFQDLQATPFVDVPLWNTLEAGFGWTARHRTQYYDHAPDPDFTDSGPTVSFLFHNQSGYQPRDPAWGMSLGGSASFFKDGWGGERDISEYYVFFETSTDFIDQDLILWTRAAWERLRGRQFLADEFIQIESLVRGAESLEGLEGYKTSAEVRFPIYRNLLWQPFEVIGLGEWLILKDLRGFVFGDVGYLRTDVGNLINESWWAWSTGAGLRLDLSFMLWPVVNGRVPIRLEGWWAFVGQPYEENRGVLGGGFTIGF